MTTEQVDYAETLAFARKECPGDAVVPPPSYGITHALAHCTRCDDTGLVYLLPDESGVRVRCQCTIPNYGPGYSQWVWERCVECEDGRGHSASCITCGGKEVAILDPTTHGDTWARALYRLVFGDAPWDLTLNTDWKWEYANALIWGDTPAALKVAYNALVAAGVVQEN